MEGAILKGANLRESHLEGVWFGSADLSEVDLTAARLHNTDFEAASLARAELLGAHIDGSTSLVGVYWGDDYVLATEMRGKFDWAEEIYRLLKQHYRDSGDYRTAAEFYFREMECLRKQRNVESVPPLIPQISSGDLYSDGGKALRHNVVLNYIRAANASLSPDRPAGFLCHSSSDKPFARRLAMELVANGINVWIDEAEIGIGDSLIEKIESGISGSKYLILVLSKNSINSSWCTDELSIAMNGQVAQRGLDVLPVLIDDCEIPDSLKEKRYADFRNANDFDRVVAELCAAIQ
jgi:hypothetical protein